MKTLEKEFIRNVDMCGDNRFVQVKREGDFCAYIRYKIDKSVFGYELFKVKVVKAGSRLPNNTLVEEDYEVYPSKHAFGKTASFYSFKNEININSLFKTFVSTFKSHDEKEIVNITNEIILSNEPFSVKTLMTLNPTKSYLECYQYIKENLDKTIVFIEKVPSSRGKPTNLYKKIV